MRRKDRALGDAEALKIIDECEYGVVSCSDDEGGIFSIPISIARRGESVFIHGGVSGTKARLFQNGRGVKLVCVSHNRVPSPSRSEFESMLNDGKKLGNLVFTTEYKSAIALTKAYEIRDEERKIEALRLLCEKYTPEFMQGFELAVKTSLKITNIYELVIQNLSAKAKIL